MSHPPPLLLPALLAQESTTTTAVPRITGEPLDSWVTIAASIALLVLILVAGAIATRRMRRDRPRR